MSTIRCSSQTWKRLHEAVQMALLQMHVALHSFSLFIRHQLNLAVRFCNRVGKLLSGLGYGVHCLTAECILAGYHHDMNYRSVTAFGKAMPVTDEAEKEQALGAFVDHIIPGRNAQVFCEFCLLLSQSLSSFQDLRVGQAYPLSWAEQHQQSERVSLMFGSC